MRIVFICEANSTRSQLAEGLAKKLWVRYKSVIESCGSFDGGGVNPLVKKILQEYKIDSSNQYSKHYTTLVSPESIDWVVILCGRDFLGDYFKNAQKIHNPLSIPGIVLTDNSSILDSYRNLALKIEELLLDIEKIIFKR